MFELASFLYSMTVRGLIFSLIVAAVYITSRIIKFDDLTIEGSFGIGGATMATCLSLGIHPLIGMLIALVSGGLAGAATGLLHTKLHLNNLISGIVVTTALFSISLKIGSAQQDVSAIPKLFDMIPKQWGVYREFLILVPFIGSCIVGLKWFLKTEYGFLLHAIGQNPQMLINLNKNPHRYLLTALILGNTLTAIAGALFVQHIGYFSIWSNIGILVISLIGLSLAELINSRFGIALIFGATAYQAIILSTYELNIDQQWNKLINALLIILLMIFNHLKNRRFKGNKHA